MRFEGVIGSFSLLVIIIVATSLSPAPSFADTVTLKNGREIHGRLVNEELDSIRIRTSGGTITIPKTEIATYTENQNFEDTRARTKAQIAADEAREAKRAREMFREKPKGDGDKGDGDKGDGDKGDGDKGDGDKEPWAWSDEISDEEIEELIPIRDELLRDLAALGLTKEERLKRVELTKTEQRDLNDRIATLGRRTHRRSRANLQRANALRGILETYGLKAFDKLVHGMASKTLWISRMCLEGVGELSDKGDPGEAKWLAFNFGAPSKLAELMDHQGVLESHVIRKIANETLRAFLPKKRYGFRASNKSISTPAESKAARKWRDYCGRATRNWKKKQEETKLQFEKVKEDLEKLKKGIKPGDADAK